MMKMSLKYVEHVEKLATELANIKANKNIVMTEYDWQDYNSAGVCLIRKEECEDDKDKNNKIKVRDHDHYTGKYTGAAHKNCNLKFKKPNFVLVIFHNGSGYDFH